MNNVPWSPPDIGPEEIAAAKKVIDSGWLTQGKITEQFEKEIEKKVGCRNAVVVNNGTSALVASLLAHGIGHGDEVIVPTYTFIATVNSVLAVGATPVLVDCDKTTFNTTPEMVLEKITPKTKAIMPVDVAGMPVDINGFADLARDQDILFIQDSAESLGAEYRGRKVGGFDNTSVFSFHMAKLSSTIEGGCVLTNDNMIADRVRMIRNHGMKGKYDYACFGLNFRTTDIQSAIGIEQLKKLDRYIHRRNKLAQIYEQELQGIVGFQQIPDYVTVHPRMLFGILVEKEKRDSIISALNAQGIGTRICWPPTHTQEYHKTLFAGSYPNAEEIGKSIINIPMGNDLNEEQVHHVVEKIKEVLRQP